ncbi:MAG: PqqD family protein [Bdellovibrio sp. CG12_big_fil_rev_8_21_14_0_65_39_13]|nr:MAG: PqqD family protein [Bdellovibrio sp. CG22_combo_CG10-13_8_21_14_all_39_27]PIQ57739.1 MAG: PqqD family protein [Bdellovibrio sp. CG12_big_fil_rev_8_21_14_0_65_39_13]PIR36531.1 MAG: PqqD family protein [Bdellovibrio sp. CG11_big_fil_rev_8_21_14_0_20_39_38]
MSYKKRSDLALKMIGEQLVIIDSKIGKAVHRLNDVGVFIWDLIESSSSDEILAKLMDEFEVDEAEARADLKQFVADLEALQLIEKSHE